MPLGLQMTTVGALGGPNTMGDPGGTAVIEDYYFKYTLPLELET